MQPRPVKTIHVFLIAILLGLCFSLLSEFAYSEVGFGWVDSGFPLLWKRVYGGVTPQYNYLYFFGDVAIWTIVCFIIIFAVFKYAFGWKPS